MITSLPATQLAVVTQPSTTAESGVVFGAQPVIEIRDATNTKVAGAINSVTVSLASGSGTLVGTTTVAAVNGTATFTNLQINGTGAHTLQFISGVLAGANSGTITVSQVVRTVAITTQPGGALSGASLSPQPVITLRDQAGLTVSAATNSVTAAVASGTGALSGTTSLNAVAGVATFTDLKITGSGSHTLSFTIAGPLSATSGSFTITAVATKIAIVTQPAGATESGVVFPTQPVIEIQDATSTRVPGATNAVTVSLASGTGALSGTLTVAAVNGTATFTDLKIAGSGAHTLSFTSGVLTGAGPSGTVTVTQVVRSVSITTQPGGALSGSILSTQPVITLKDQAGLTVASATSTVTAAKASGPGVLGGTVAVAAVGGVATFADLKITGAGTHTISFSITVPSALSAISGNVVITAPPPPSFALDITGPASVSLVSGGVSAGVTLTITNGSGAVGANAGAAQFDLTWDKTKFTFVSVVGSGLPAGCSPSIGPPDLVNGKVTVGFTCTTGLTATQSLFTLSLIASATGSGSVGASNLIAADELANTIAVPVHSLTVTITP